jgi:hypothetical protein
MRFLAPTCGGGFIVGPAGRRLFRRCVRLVETQAHVITGRSESPAVLTCGREQLLDPVQPMTDFIKPVVPCVSLVALYEHRRDRAGEQSEQCAQERSRSRPSVPGLLELSEFPPAQLRQPIDKLAVIA